MSGQEARAGTDASSGQGVQAGDHNEQVNVFTGDQQPVDARADRDVYAAGRDLTINSYAAPDMVWLGRNRALPDGGLGVGSYGARELAPALDVLFPGRVFPARWAPAALADLHREVDAAHPSVARTRVSRMLDSLAAAMKTTAFLRSFVGGSLTEQALLRALAAVASRSVVALRDVPAADLATDADVVQFVSLTHPHAERTCGRQLARFVLDLVSESRLDAGDPRIAEWAAGIGALPAFNTEAAATRPKHADRRLRLVVSLHYDPAQDWPEALGAWLLLDDEWHAHEDFPAEADQPGAEQALASAVDWAEAYADVLGLRLQRIEVAMPTRILLRWRPEEVLYGQRLGVNFDVLARWSQRLDQRPAIRRANRNARRRLAEIAAGGPGARLHWLSARHSADLAQLSADFEQGVYSRAIGLTENPGRNADVLDVALTFTPILLWPQGERLGQDHQATIDAYWESLPAGFLVAYRSRWLGEDGHGNGDRMRIADVRAVWDHEDWLNFCRQLAP
jgi:hypothetical protein